MRFETFVARRLHAARPTSGQRVSPPAIRLAVAGIAIGLAVMLVSVAIVIGFKHDIRQKISDFGGHLQVLSVAANRSWQQPPICYSDSLLRHIASLPGVRDVSPFITRPAVLKTDHDFLSVVVRSADTLSEREVLISPTLARRMQLTADQSFRLFFVGGDEAFQSDPSQSSIRQRTVRVKGFFQTHFNDYDSQVVLASPQLLQQAGGWDEDMASGLSVRLTGFDQLDRAYVDLTQAVSLSTDRCGTQLIVQDVRQQNLQMFAWLDLLDTNVWVILGLMIVVSAFTMISGLIIIILERTQMIGLLKALGASNGQLRRVFLQVACRLTLRGLFWGNLIGLCFCFVQHRWHLLTLDPENYYLEWVPISLSLLHVVLLNVATLLIIITILIVPASLVARISPTRSLTFNS